MQRLAREMNIELAKQGHKLRVFISGWNTLEEHITRYRPALEEFDPTYGAFGKVVAEKTDRVLAIQTQMSTNLREVASAVSEIKSLQLQLNVSPGDMTITVQVFEQHLDDQVNDMRDLANSGKPEGGTAPA